MTSGQKWNAISLHVCVCVYGARVCVCVQNVRTWYFFFSF